MMAPVSLQQLSKQGVVLALLVFAMGCGQSSTPDTTPVAVAPTPIPAPSPADRRTPRLGSLESDCSRADKCMAGYDRFIDRATEHARPVERDELWRRMWAIVDGDVTVDEAAPQGSTLRQELTRDSNVEWLLAEADRGKATVSECGTTLWGPAKEIRLCIDDPWVGQFEALLLLPGLDGPYPAIVAHPGHAETAAYHRDYRHGRAIIEAGYVLAILEPRAFAGDEYEHEVAERLLLKGHVLVSLRLYELAVLHHYLAKRDDVDGERIGLMGHSGGSDPSSLAAFVDTRWQAVAIDIVGWFMARIDDNGQLSSEASPNLWRWHKLIESTEPPVPRLRQDYGYPQGPGPFLKFFDQHLKRPAKAP